MEDPLAFEKQFNQIVASVETKGISTEQRIQDASVDRRLIIAVYDEISAQVELTLLFDEVPEVYKKRHDEAQKRVIEIAAHLQYEYGLDEKDILKAVELARMDIQNNKIIFD